VSSFLISKRTEAKFTKSKDNRKIEVLLPVYITQGDFYRLLFINTEDHLDGNLMSKILDE
jgi:hypothetical protein